MKFRKLRVDEIEVRVGMVKQTGCSLLLYKDARCDMNILDETVGVENWQRDHKELKGNIYAGVSIFNEKLNNWIWKWDCGSESYTEKEKGEASDSFKRACVNWGIGRELYTSPFIWINNQNCTIEKHGNSFKVKDKFKVKKISYKDNKISELEIENIETHKVVYTFGTIKITEKVQPKETVKIPMKATKQQFDLIQKAINEKVMSVELVQTAIKEFGAENFKYLTYEQAESICKTAKKRLFKEE